MSHGRSIRLPSANVAQVPEPGRNGPAVTRSPQVGRGGSNPPLCTMCQRARIGIAACLRNRCLRVRISPLAPDFYAVFTESQERAFRPLPLPLHADYLAQGVYYVHQIALRFHYGVDGLVRHRSFVDDVGVLTARAPMLPGMIPMSPSLARTAPLRVMSTFSP